MLKVVDIEYIRKKHFLEGWSIRKIAKQCEVSRQTVRKALVKSGPWKYTLKQPKPSPTIDPHRHTVITWLNEDRYEPPKQRHTARRIYARLCEEYGFTGAESTVRRYVAGLRRELGQSEVDTKLLLEASAGEMAQVDWGKARVVMKGLSQEVYVFCLRLRHSSVPFVWASPHERMEAFLEGHVRAFEWLGGVPRRLVYDNLTTAVRKVLKDHERDLNGQFAGIRSHYLFESVFCNPSAAHEKGSVENLVGYVRRNALTPQPRVEHFDELNAHLLKWCENERLKNSCRWTQERGALIHPTGEALRPCSSTVVRVDKLSLITFQRNRYSVPNEYIGLSLRLDSFTHHIELWHREKLVTTHERPVGRDHNILKLEHYLRAISRKPYAVHNAAVVRQLPEPYQQARALLCSVPGGYREMARLLMLHSEFPANMIEQAVVNAVAVGCVRVDEIRQQLLNNAPKRMLYGDIATSLADLRVQVGDPGQYNKLLEEVSS